MKLGEKLSKLRKDNNLTQEQLADLLEVTRQTISRWESDIAFPETDKLLQLSYIFKCSVDFLLKENLSEKNSMIVEIKEVKVNTISKKIRILLVLMISLIILLSSSLMILICNNNKNSGSNTPPFENDEFYVEFQSNDNQKVLLNKQILNNGERIVVTYTIEHIEIGLNDIFRIYCENSNITITCFNEFLYLNDGYYKNLNEGTYELIISINYQNDTILDISTSALRTGTAYNNVEMHVLKYDSHKDITEWEHEKYSMNYMENLSFAIGKNSNGFIYEQHQSLWSTHSIFHHISNNDYMYFTVDGKSIDIQFGTVLSGIYSDYFVMDDETGYVKALQTDFRNRDMFLYIENGSIYFDTPY